MVFRSVIYMVWAKRQGSRMQKGYRTQKRGWEAKGIGKRKGHKEPERE